MISPYSVQWVDSTELGRHDAYIPILQDIGFVETMLRLPRNSSHWSRRIEYPWAVCQSEIAPTMAVIDAGGGESSFQFYLSYQCKTVFNIDHDIVALGNSKKICERANIQNLKQICAELTDVPVADNTVDLVFCISALEHSKADHVKIVEEMLRVIKPGGRLLLTIDVPVFSEDVHVFDSHLSFFQIQSMLAEFGIRIPIPHNITGSLQFTPDGRNWQYIYVLCVCIQKATGNAIIPIT